MTTERQALGQTVVQETSTGLPLAAVLLFAALLSLSVLSAGSDEVPAPTRAAPERIASD